LDHADSRLAKGCPSLHAWCKGCSPGRGLDRAQNKTDASTPTGVLSTTLALALPWALLFWQLHYEWSVNPQYGFGWGIPLLAAYLFLKRWPHRPATDDSIGGPVPCPAASDNLLSLLPKPTGAGPHFGPASERKNFGNFLMLAGLLAALLPIRLVQEANPDWRLIDWLLALCVTGLGLSALAQLGGRSWVRHFSVPLMLPLLAVPWPTQLEQTVVQSLMRGVAAATTECMNLLGIAAAQRGNLIELSNGVVGVNEACSGIRSVQTALMVAVAAGELYRLTAGARFAVLVGGLGWAVLLNLFRTGLLTWICAHSGTAAQVAWHDRAGYLMLGLAIAGIWLAAWWMGQRSRRPGLITAPRSGARGPEPSHPYQHFPRGFPPRLAWIMIGWLAFVEVVTEGWYRAHESVAAQRLAWTIRWPERASGFLPTVLPDRVRMILRCDQGESGVWRRSDGSEWTVFFLKWHPGRLAARLARGHTPDVCLPAQGFQNLGGLGLATVRLSEGDLPFNAYAFENRGQLYFVFFCLMDPSGALLPDQASSAARMYLAELSRARRLRAVCRGIRHRGQQVLEIAMTGYATSAQAQAALRATLPHLVHFNRNTT
jgi:exosortase